MGSRIHPQPGEPFCGACHASDDTACTDEHQAWCFPSGAKAAVHDSTCVCWICLAQLRTERDALKAEVERLRAATCGRRCGDNGKPDTDCVLCEVHNLCHLCVEEQLQAERDRARARVAELEQRRDELLALVAAVSKEAPDAGEARDLRGQVAALIAEVGTLRARASACRGFSSLCADCTEKLLATKEPTDV